MTQPRWLRLLAIALTAVLVLGACGSDDDEGGGTTDTGSETTDGTDGGDGGDAAFSVDVGDCPDGVEDPIQGPVKIGTTMPLSGGAAAAAFAPVAAGFKAYVAYANAQGLLADHELELFIEDDQFNSNLTTPAVEKLLDQTGVHLFSAMIGTANNQAVRDLLNEECYPQLFALTGAPIWGEVENYPWTTGGLVPYNTETAVYVEDMTAKFPDGATAAVFHINSEFGDAYFEAFDGLAGDAGIEIVDEQTIENADLNPPTSQVTSIASKKPDIILAVPLGAQCPTFLKEIQNAKAANPGWEPRVYITATCASTLLLAISGDASNGIITVVTAKDPADPKNAADADIVKYKEAMTASGFPADGDFATAGAGWTSGELTVQVLIAAAASEGGLTRKSILEAARAIDFGFLLARDGLKFTMNGATDAYGLESMQVVQYDAATKTYTDQGSLVTKYEGTTKLPE